MSQTATLGLGKRLWTSYNSSLARRPLLTKVLTGVAGTIIGDGMAQYMSYHSAQKAKPKGRQVEADEDGKGHLPTTQGFQYDFGRLGRLCLWSALVATPLAHYWFNFLDSRVMPRNPTAPLAIATKLLLDQGFMAPFGLSLFFVGIKCLEGQAAQAIPDMQAKIWPTMMANYALWPAANFINFRFIPTEQRVLYVNVIAVFWASYLSHIQSARPAAA